METPWTRPGSPPVNVDLHRGFHGVGDWDAWWTVMDDHTESGRWAGATSAFPTTQVRPRGRIARSRRGARCEVLGGPAPRADAVRRGCLGRCRGTRRQRSTRSRPSPSACRTMRWADDSPEAWTCRAAFPWKLPRGQLREVLTPPRWVGPGSWLHRLSTWRRLAGSDAGRSGIWPSPPRAWCATRGRSRVGDAWASAIVRLLPAVRVGLSTRPACSSGSGGDTCTHVALDAPSEHV